MYPSADSSVTLVNPSSQTVISFDKNSTFGATLLIKARPVYKLTTDEGILKTRAIFTDVTTGNAIATIERKEIGSDRVACRTLAGGKKTKLSEWMNNFVLPDGRTASSFCTDVGTFVWLSSAASRLSLFPENGIDSVPVAYMMPATSTSALQLVIENQALIFIDQLLASWLIKEHSLRMWERSMEVAGGMLQSEGHVLD